MSLVSRRIHPIVILLLITLPGWAQQTPAFSLEEAVEYAHDQSVEVKNARLRVLDAEQQIIERRSIGLPQLSAEANFNRYLQVPVQPLPEAFIQFLESINPNGEVDREASFLLNNNFSAGVNLDMMVFDGTYFTGLKAARAFREYTAQELVTTKRQIRNSVIDAYLPLLQLEKNIELIDKNVANLEKLLEETRALYEEGFAEQLDVDRQQLSLNNLLVERENLVRQRESALARLKYIMGYPADEPLLVSEDLEEMAIGVEEEALTAAVNPGARPEFVLAEEGIDLQELNVKVNKAAYLPKLNAYGAYQQSYQGNNFKDGFWAPTANVGVRLSIPIFDGFYRKSQVERAQIDLEEAQNQQRDLQRAINLEVTNARNSYLNAMEALDGQRDNLELAERIYETTQIKYREGVGSSVELTQAEQSLYRAQTNYTNALYNVLSAKMDLKMALGN